MKRRIPFHPPLIAAFPILSLYSANLALVPYHDIWRPLAYSIGSVLLVWLVAAGIFRSIARGAAAASVVAAAIFAFSWIVVTPDEIQDHTWRNAEIGAWLIVVGFVMWVFVRKAKRGDWQTGALNVAGTALVISSVGSIVFGLMAESRHLAQLGKVAEQTSNINANSLPDIYYVILDGYGREDQLKRVFGYDNSAFTKALEDRGFYVAKAGHSNYCQTELSLPSSLNLDLIQNLLPKMGGEEFDRSPLDELVIDNKVSRHLKSLGYQYIAITSGFPSFAMHKADLWFRAPMKTTLFESAVLQLTPFDLSTNLSGSMFGQRRADLLGAMSNLDDQSQRNASPKFVFTHILMPHPPFVFDAEGHDQRFEKLYGYWDGSHYYQFGGTRDEYKRGYTGQVTFLNKKFMPLIDDILKQGRPRPIIIVQGDHGSKLGLDQQYVEKTDLNECFSNLNAYYVPDEMRAKLYPSITPVNSFRLLFNTLFGEKWPLYKDQSWYSSIDTPYKMIEVTDRLQKGPTP